MKKNHVVRINKDMEIIGYGKVKCGKFFKFKEAFENKYGKFLYAIAEDGGLLLLLQKDCEVIAI